MALSVATKAKTLGAGRSKNALKRTYIFCLRARPAGVYSGAGSGVDSPSGSSSQACKKNEERRIPDSEHDSIWLILKIQIKVLLLIFNKVIPNLIPWDHEGLRVHQL
jgi:hypothetical protein